MSLRTRVAIASALAAGIVIVAIGVSLAVFLRVNGTEQLSQTLDSVVVAARVTPPATDGRLETTLPTLAPEPATNLGSMPGPGIRVRDVQAPDGSGSTLSLSVPEAPLAQAIREQQVAVGGFAVIAIGLAGGLGWLLAGRAVRPLARLAANTEAIGSGTRAEWVSVRGVKEAENISEAMDKMVARINNANNRIEVTLRSARDFAAVSAHQLRTPLTSMRTDIEVLASMPLTAAQRDEVHRDLLATQRQVETTLSDLEQLALGEMVDATDHDDVELVELVDRCVQDIARTHRDLSISFTAPDSVAVRGSATGLRLILDNAIANAVRHGRAHRVIVAIEPLVGDGKPSVVMTVDDDGVGVPEHERIAMFERFARGAESRIDGSGLGLALVAQQAALHGGSAVLLDSPLGGARLMVCLAGQLGQTNRLRKVPPS
ncbi:MAG: sensor histidine kinase [Rhodococcus sp. (in: high G+C Gram-positive bacteria)]